MRGIDNKFVSRNQRVIGIKEETGDRTAEMTHAKANNVGILCITSVHQNFFGESVTFRGSFAPNVTKQQENGKSTKNANGVQLRYKGALPNNQ